MKQACKTCATLCPTRLARDYVSLSNAARFFNLSLATLSVHAKNERLPVTRLGKRVYVLRSLLTDETKAGLRRPRRGPTCETFEPMFVRIKHLVGLGHTIKEACGRLGVHSTTLYKSTDARLLRELYYERAIVSGSFYVSGKYYPTLHKVNAEGIDEYMIDPTPISRSAHYNLFPDEIIDAFL